jgi:gamma-glutamyltranspeptidase/glutathione hydrolase
MGPSAKGRVAVATTSQLAADAAAEIADLGGNAVDCGIAASMCSINTQPGVCALAGSAFVTVWAPDGSPVTIDGNVAIPGVGETTTDDPPIESVTIAYGGGVETLVGVASVAVPGTLAALYRAASDYGKLPWRELLQPSVRAARDGFPLAQACHYYLGYAGDVIYGRSPDGHAALHHDDGTLRDAGSPIVVPHLADSIAALADEGPDLFYKGELGTRIIEHVRAGGGRLTGQDLALYSADIRPSLMVDAGDWQIAMNPPPAIGGANLAAMLCSFGTDSFDGWTHETLARLVNTQMAAMRYRQRHLDIADDVDEPVAEFLSLAADGALLSKYASAATVHTSAVDEDGLGCAITASSGYGAGEMAPGTGIWLNNCLGELELNRHGLSAGPPGRRLPSNMAPGCARSKRAALAFGSPGADRITTALHQFLINYLQAGLDLDDAVAHPRVHLRIDDDRCDLAAEPGVDLPELDMEVTRFEDINMYFGGVAATVCDDEGKLSAAADPRREGGTFIGP